jgi:GDP-mannose 6-dehydrogenase
MNLSIFGLGYVGCVSAGCFADQGHDVIGVDKNQNKVDMINKGISPIVEKDIDTLISRMVNASKLRATTNAFEAVHHADVILICVGTPSNGNGSIDFNYIQRVCKEIGQAMAYHDKYITIAIRSTVLPRIAEEIAIPTLEKYSWKTVGKDFGFCLNPEFLREGCSVFDFINPPKTVIGEYDKRSGDALEELYSVLDAPLFRIGLREASMIKYADNCFHAVKVTFANEISRVCKQFGVNSREVMNIFVSDTKLNISSEYLNPGFALGGSCLPKDLRAITYCAKQVDVDLPMLAATMESNRKHIDLAIEMIKKTKKKRIGLLGMSFKAGTDDLRESPTVTLIEYLIGKGYELNIYDKNVSMARLIGANKEYIEKEIPHIAKLMCSSIDEVIEKSEVLVIGNNAQEYEHAFRKAKPGITIIDLAGLKASQNEGTQGVKYEGLCW